MSMCVCTCVFFVIVYALCITYTNLKYKYLFNIILLNFKFNWRDLNPSFLSVCLCRITPNFYRYVQEKYKHDL